MGTVLPGSRVSHRAEPATSLIAVTPSDTNDIDTTNHAATKALWVGGAGAVAVIMDDGTTGTLSGIPAGTMLWISATRVKATGTTATLIVALF